MNQTVKPERLQASIQLRRVGAALGELWLDLRIQALRRSERRALIRLGAAAASAGVEERGELKKPLAQVRSGKLRLDDLRAAIGASLAADQRDFVAASAWMRPVVVLRGLCTRAVLRHQVALGRRSLREPHEALGSAMAQGGKAGADLPETLVSAVAEARSKLRALSEERSRRLEPFGGTALPRWVPRIGSEMKALAGAFGMQLKPSIFLRAPLWSASLSDGGWPQPTPTHTSAPSCTRLASAVAGGG